MTREELTSLKVVILAGGWSDESEISLQSAQNVQESLAEAGFSNLTLLNVADEDFFTKISTGNFDVAFIAMHGRYGEDGAVQGMLDLLHMPYTFGGVLSQAISTEKEVAKILYKQAGVATPRGVDIAAQTQLTSEQVDTLVEEFGLPLFVKPSGNGSSFGASLVKDVADLQKAVDLAGSQGERVLIEEVIKGTEISIPVIGNDKPQALPIVEIVYDTEFYDIQAKDEPGSMHHVIPARLEPMVYAKAQDMAVRAHKALGCRGVSRSDFIVTEEGIPYILETNSIPGMTKRSLLPDSARHGGIEFSELCCRFIEFAMEDAASGRRK